MADATTASLSMERGDADFFLGLNTSDREHVAAAKGVTIQDVPSNLSLIHIYQSK